MKKQTRIKSWLKSFYASDEELAAYELSEQAEVRGSILIEEVQRGESIQVTGVVKSVKLRRMRLKFLMAQEVYLLSGKVEDTLWE